MRRPRLIDPRNDAEGGANSLSPQAPGEVLARWEPHIRLAAKDDGQSISIFDEIGEGLFSEGVTTKRIDAALRRIGAGKDVTVNINSPGGNMFEGFGIYNLLREHKGKVTVRVLGLAASAASIIAMAGDRVIMNRGSMMFIHNPFFVAAGDHVFFEEVVKKLKKFAAQGVEIYSVKTGLGSDEIEEMMNAETWFSAKEAVNKGFADESEAIKVVNSLVEDGGGKSRAKAMERLKVALAKEGLTRSERLSIFKELGLSASVTAPTPASVTGDDASVMASLDSLCQTMRG